MKKGRERTAHSIGNRLTTVIIVFYVSAFTLLGLRDLQWQAFAIAGGTAVILWAGTHILPRIMPCDRFLLTLTNFLCALGVLVLYATKPETAMRQMIYYGAGIVVMFVCAVMVRSVRSWTSISLLLIPVSLGLLALPILIGHETNGASNWIYVGGISFQPSEFVKITLLIVLAWGMSKRRFFVWAAFAVCSLAALMLQKDLGTALLYYGVTLLLFYASSVSIVLTGIGLAGGAGAAFLGYRMFSHVKRRVAIWLNPWADYENAGYQLAQGLMALASSGLLGVGLGLGSPTSIPVYETDFIFSVICEQFGLIFGVCVLLIYAAIIVRGAAVAREARRSFHGLLAMGAVLFLGLQTFVIIGGVIKLIPLTGVTLPFVSSGGSSLVSSMGMIGLISGVDSVNRADLREDVRIAHYDEDEDI